MGEPHIESGLPDFDNDYQIVRLSVRWGSLSIVAFVATLTLTVVGDNLGASFRQLIAATMGLSIVGLLLGLIGLKSGRSSRGAARVGAFLNGVVVGILLVILPAVFQILRRLD